MNSYQGRKPRRETFSVTLDALLSNLAHTSRSLKQGLSMGVDAGLVVVSLWFAYSLRYGESFSDFRNTWYLFALLPFATIWFHSGLGVYRWVIRSSNQRLFRQLFKGSILSSMLLLLVFFLIPPDRTNPRSLFVIYGMLLLLGTIGVRVAWRTLFDLGSKGKPVAIYGAGSAGKQLASLLRVGGEYRPIAFVDDDLQLSGSTLSGLPVFSGSDSGLKSKLHKLETHYVVLAIPSLSSPHYTEKLNFVNSLGFHALTMPSVTELMSGKVRVDEIRDISITDILGRSEVMPDMELMKRRVTDKTVLVTGGGGSIGSELCRQIMQLQPRQLLILDNCEVNLYNITEEFKAAAKASAFATNYHYTPVLGSVTDSRRIRKLLADNTVDTIFHAAAYKHVPIVEAQPDQGVFVNVQGTLTVLDAAIDYGVSDFLFISTDKAVRPTNVMGGTKRVAELILQAKARTQDTTRICMVRFGNVLGSSGSVVPKFKKQILSGGPITLTHSDITRYFMTIPEAAQLVMQASAIAKGGDVFVLDMGEPVRIGDLATSMVRLYGKQLQCDTGNPNDVAIVIEGLRPGEKMYEELFISNNRVQTEVAKISSADEIWLEWSDLSNALDQLLDAARREDSQAVREQVLSLAFVGQHVESGEEQVCADFTPEKVIQFKPTNVQHKKNVDIA